MTLTHLAISLTCLSYMGIFTYSNRIGRFPRGTLVTEDRPWFHRLSFSWSFGVLTYKKMREEVLTSLTEFCLKLTHFLVNCWFLFTVSTSFLSRSTFEFVCGGSFSRRWFKWSLDLNEVSACRLSLSSMGCLWEGPSRFVDGSTWEVRVGGWEGEGLRVSMYPLWSPYYLGVIFVWVESIR